MDAAKIIYWIVTVLFCLMMLGSAGMYIVNYESVSDIFRSLNYPVYIIYPLAAAKTLGVIAILSNYSKILKEWAYAGFFYDLLLAASAHYVADIPNPLMAVAALVLLIISYLLDKKINR